MQTLAVDLLACHEGLHEASLRAVAMAALCDGYAPELGARAVDVLASRAKAGVVPPAAWHSLLAAVLLGSMTGEQRMRRLAQKRPRQLVRQAPAGSTAAVLYVLATVCSSNCKFEGAEEQGVVAIPSRC